MRLCNIKIISSIDLFNIYDHTQYDAKRSQMKTAGKDDDDRFDAGQAKVLWVKNGLKEIGNIVDTLYEFMGSKQKVQCYIKIVVHWSTGERAKKRSLGKDVLLRQLSQEITIQRRVLDEVTTKEDI